MKYAAFAGLLFVSLLLNSEIAHSSPLLPSLFAPTLTNSSGSGYQCIYIRNFTAATTQGVTIFNKDFLIKVSYIAPASAGLYVNNYQYVLAKLNSINLGVFYGINYSLKLINVSNRPYYVQYVPTIAISVCGRTTENYTELNVTTKGQSLDNFYNVSVYHGLNVSVLGLGLDAVLSSNSTSNSTEHVVIDRYIYPVSVPGYKLISAINVSAVPSDNISVHISYRYNCSIQAAEVQPFVLYNSTWIMSNGPKANASMCSIEYSVPAKEEVTGVFEHINTTTPSAHENVTTSTIPPKKNYLIGVLVGDLVNIGIAVIVIIAAIWLIYRNRLMKEKELEKRRGRQKKLAKSK